MKISKNDIQIYLLLLLAFVLRLPGVFDGLPAVFNSTEYLLAKVALNMGAQQTLDPGIYIYPTFYSYLLFLIYGLYFTFSHIFGLIGNSYDFALQFLIDPAAFYILPRLFNSLLSILTVFIVYHLLKKMENGQVARYAAIVMLFSSYLTNFSVISTPDTLLVFFSTLTTLYFYRIAKEPSLKNFFLSGLFAGFAIAAKYNAGFLVVGLILSGILMWRKNQISFLKTSAMSLTGVFLGFFIMNPLWLIYPLRFIEGFHLVTAQMFMAVSAEKGLPYLWELLTLVNDELMIGLLFIVATSFYFFKTDIKHIPGLTVIILTFLFVGIWTKKGIDYLFAIYPAWIILSGYYLTEYIRPRFTSKRGLHTIFLLIFLPSFLSISLITIRTLNQDTREQATEWLIGNQINEKKICYDNSHFDLGTFDIHRYLEYGEGAGKLPDQVKQRLHKFKDAERQIDVLPILVKNPSCTLKTNNPYESESIRFRRRSLSELAILGVDYVIVNSWFYDSYLTANMRAYAPGIQINIMEVQEFYKSLFNTYEPVKVFRANFWQRGPDIKVYKLNQDRW